MSMSTTSVEPAATELLERHRQTLDGALEAIATRGYWSPYPELPKAYGEEAPAAGLQAFKELLGQRFSLEQPSPGDWVGDERSPYGFELGVSYPRADVDGLIAAAGAAVPAWRDAGVDARTGVVLEILARLNARSHEIAHAVMHTTGQAFPMAFQAGGPHAQDRGLEAVAYAYQAMSAVPREALWEKPQGKRPPLRMRKRFTVTPRGVALVIGCNTFPTWNGYPGLFASLVTGNPVIVKPSSRAILPLAITVSVAREVLNESGFSADIVSLAVGGRQERLASTLAQRPEVRVIDYTGSSEFGVWLEREAPQAVVFTEKAGVNPIVIDSTDDYRGMLANIAFTLSLYSGQMCTTPQNIFLPRDGIETDQDHRSFEQLAADLGSAIEELLSDPARAGAILGAIANRGVLDRLESAGELGHLVLASKAMEHPEHPEAIVRTPALVSVEGPDDPAIQTEHFGPVSLLVPTDGTDSSLDAFGSTVRRHGAITAGVYSTSDEVVRAAERVGLEAGVALSFNLTGGVYVNQSSAYSDFHATGLNPAANASLTDLAFVTPRFHVVQSREHVAEHAEGS
ncbi:MAG: phenylacetic acid degradation protein PaaN [Actinomycetota bacterium]|nr:phenylacetic acid degradation protein PaaN [Actinomycetota bacterium]